MPAEADWSWVEAYGLLEADPSIVHGKEWNSAISHVDESISKVVPAWDLEQYLERTADLANTPPDSIILNGSGWGALENLRREKIGAPHIGSPGTPFPASTLGPEQRHWRTLLETNHFPEPENEVEIYSWVTTPEWRELLLRSLSEGSEHYASWLHLGVMHFSNDELELAKNAWERSFALCPTIYSLRNLAQLARIQDRPEEQLALIKKAHQLAPDNLPLAIECLKAFLDQGDTACVLQLFQDLPPALQNNGRIQLILAQAQAKEDPAKALARLQEPWDVVDLKEGDNALTDLWFQLHEHCVQVEEDKTPEEVKAQVRIQFPPPAHLEFRMRIS